MKKFFLFLLAALFLFSGCSGTPTADSSLQVESTVSAVGNTANRILGVGAEVTPTSAAASESAFTPSAEIQPSAAPKPASKPAQTVQPSAAPKPTSTPVQAVQPSATPAPTVAPVSSDSQETNSYTVYITETGEKYHRSGCQYLRNSKIEISLETAKARGYTPCSKCW